MTVVGGTPLSSAWLQRGHGEDNFLAMGNKGGKWGGRRGGVYGVDAPPTASTCQSGGVGPINAAGSLPGEHEGRPPGHGHIVKLLGNLERLHLAHDGFQCPRQSSSLHLA